MAVWFRKMISVTSLCDDSSIKIKFVIEINNCLYIYLDLMFANIIFGLNVSLSVLICLAIENKIME